MTEMVSVPRSALRELSKWAFAAAHFDGMVAESELEGLGSPIRDCITEIKTRNYERESSDEPWISFPNGYSDV